jgi:hypothetical protein
MWNARKGNARRFTLLQAWTRAHRCTLPHRDEDAHLRELLLDKMNGVDDEVAGVPTVETSATALAPKS